MQVIFVTGVQRSGTTWIAGALAAGTRGRLVHEPFNWRLHGDETRSRYYMRYLPAGAADPRFTAILRAAIDGERRAVLPLRRRPVVLKDVHACLAVEAVERELDPVTVIVARHPCAVADSWARLDYSADRVIEALLAQEELRRAHLGAFEAHMRSADDYFFRLGAFWGAAYHTLQRLSARHPRWQLITHEAVCRDPVEELEALLRRAGLRMTLRGRRFLAAHDQEEDGGRPYSTRRVTAREPDKWRDLLAPDAAARVLEGARPFGVLERLYPNTSAAAS